MIQVINKFNSYNINLSTTTPTTQLLIRLTKDEKPIVRMMTKKMEQSIAVRLEDLTPFVKVENHRPDKNAERQIIKRLANKGVVKSIAKGKGMYVLTEYEEQIKKI